MPFTLIIIIFFLLIDFLYQKFVEQKEKPQTTPEGEKINKGEKRQMTFRDLIRQFEEQFISEDEEPQPSVDQISETTKVRREGVGSQRRDELIAKQKAKIDKHSSVEASQRLKVDNVLKSPKLGDLQKPLAERMARHHIDDYDLDKRREVSIDAIDVVGIDQGRKEKYLDLKKDVLKGIIYAEILSKPKGYQ